MEPQAISGYLGNRKYDQDLIDLAARRYLDTSDEFGVSQLEPFIMLELGGNGGKCPVCKTPWRRIEVKKMCFKGEPGQRLIGDFYYYDPDCRCYPRCPSCKKSMHRFAPAHASAIDHTCPSCGWKHLQSYQVHCVRRMKQCDRSFVFFGDHWPTREESVCPTCSRGGRKKAVSTYDL